MKVARNVIVFGAGLLALSAYGIAAPSSESGQATANGVGPVVITGKKAPEALPDQEVTQRVTQALDAAPYLYSEHLSVSTADGVVTLAGMVGDDSDLRSAVRISGKVPGVKRVIDELEIMDFSRSH